MEDLFDEKLLEAIRLAEALQDGRSEEKESEGKKTEGKKTEVKQEAVRSAGRKNRLLLRFRRLVRKQSISL